MDFLGTISQKASLISVLSSNQIKNKILKFLPAKEKINLFLTCKTIKSMHYLKK